MTRGNGSGDTEALRAEIGRTRTELGETVQALAGRVDMRARLRDSAARSGQRVQRRVGGTVGGVRGLVRDVGGRARRDPVRWIIVAVGALAVVTVLPLIRRRRG